MTGRRPGTAADKAFGDVLRRHRQRAGLSQTALAQVAGISFQQLQKYETGTNRVAVGRLFELAVGLGTTPSELIAATEAEMGIAPRDTAAQ